jgi:zinc-binding alcohol dehydrogenase/oxidoreductase
MKALVLENINQPIIFKEVEMPKPKMGEVLVKIKAAALNHRDVYISKGLYANIITPVIPGSDASGIVVELGENVSADWLNREVIINPGNNWGDNPAVQSKEYHILGMPSNGTLAEYITVKADRLALKPDFLSFEQAAALPLAGLTAYRSLFTKANLKAGEKILISGIGGGVALTAMQMALAVGTEVWVSSGSDEKIQMAMDLGAKGGINYNSENWQKELGKKIGNGFDVILDSAGGEGFSYFLDVANPAARIVFYGGTRGNFKINPQKMFWKQISMFGSTMGSDEDFENMIKLVSDYKIKPVVKALFKLSEGPEAFQFMEDGKQFGKIVLNP